MNTNVKKCLVRLAGHRQVQDVLAKVVTYSQYLMGIGAGSCVWSSGEMILVEELRRNRRLGEALCVFDVGANRGDFAKLVAEGLSSLSIAVQIHAFEPGLAAHGLLVDNLRRYPNVTANRFALGQSAGVATLFYDQVGSGLASLSKRNLNHLGIQFSLHEEVRTETLDDYCGGRGIQRVDLLKIDVEGHELDVLQGATRMFKERRVAMVSFEFGGCNVDSRTYFRDFYDFFIDHGMTRIYRIVPSGYLHRIAAYSEKDEQFRTTNYVVLQNDKPIP